MPFELILAIVATIATFISVIFSIYQLGRQSSKSDKNKSSRNQLITFSIIISIILTIAIIFVSISYYINPANNTSPTPTPLPPTPTPLPYPVFKTGDVCKPPFSKFQAAGWVTVKNSFVFTGNGSNVVISPCNITTPNYSVEATITLLKDSLVGVIAHADSGGQTGYDSGSGCQTISFGRCGFFITDNFTSVIGIDNEANLTGKTHTYKLVANGVTLQLFYDNGTKPVVTKSLATYPQAGYAGFTCNDQCEVTGFTVTGI